MPIRESSVSWSSLIIVTIQSECSSISKAALVYKMKAPDAQSSGILPTWLANPILHSKTASQKNFNYGDNDNNKQLGCEQVYATYAQRVKSNLKHKQFNSWTNLIIQQLKMHIILIRRKHSLHVVGEKFTFGHQLQFQGCHEVGQRYMLQRNNRVLDLHPWMIGVSFSTLTNPLHKTVLQLSWDSKEMPFDPVQRTNQSKRTKHIRKGFGNV